jgi:glutaredoxin-like YruB-family protein
MAKAKNVKIYTSVTCPWCVKTKEFLKANNIKYEEISVTGDEKRRAEVFEKSGQMGVPVTDVEGTIIVGYDRTALKKALEL